MDSHFLLRAGIHPAQMSLKEHRQWWVGRLSGRLTEASVELVTFEDARAWLKKFWGFYSQIKEPLDVSYETKDRGREWVTLRRGTKVAPVSITDPLVFLIKVRRHGVSGAPLKRGATGHGRIVWKSQVPWSAKRGQRDSGQFRVDLSDEVTVLTSPNHHLENQQEIRVFSTGKLPAGLSSDTTYFVVDATTDTFQLSKEKWDEEIVSIGDKGYGTHAWYVEQDAEMPEWFNAAYVLEVEDDFFDTQFLKAIYPVRKTDDSVVCEARLLDLMWALEPEIFQVIEGVLEELGYLREQTFQPKLRSGLLTLWDRAALVGQGIYPSNRVTNPVEVYETFVNFFRRKNYEYGLIVILRDDGTIDRALAGTSYQRDTSEMIAGDWFFDEVEGENVFMIHSHPETYRMGARDVPEQWLDLPQGYRYPFTQLLPSPGDIQGIKTLEKHTRRCSGYIIGPDGCLRFYPYHNIDVHLPSLPSPPWMQQYLTDLVQHMETL